MRNKGKKPQSIVDKLLCDMKDDDQKQFFKMCQFNANYSDLQKFLEDKTKYEIDINTIARWYKYNRPIGKEAIILNQLITDWEGINPNTLIHLSAGITAKTILKIQELLELEHASESSKLTNLVELLKEIRQISTELNRINYEKNVNDVYKSGIIALAEELKIIFKNTPIQTPIETGISSAINKLLH